MLDNKRKERIKQKKHIQNRLFKNKKLKILKKSKKICIESIKVIINLIST